MKLNIITENIIKFLHIMLLEDYRGAGAQKVILNATGCGFDTHKIKIYIYLSLL